MAWKAGRVGLLKKLWAEGRSLGQIAQRLGGTTWKAVAFQVRRLGLPGRRKVGFDQLPEPVREYLRAFERGDVSTLSRWVAADVDHVQIGDDGDPVTEMAIIQGLGLDGVKAVIEGLHEMMRDLRIEVYEARAYAGEPDVWSVKYMLSGVWQQTIPQGFQAGQQVRLPGQTMAKVVDGKIVQLRERM
jgi:ketosteroid isomerase-like protein